MEKIHVGQECINTTIRRVQKTLFWPGMIPNIKRICDEFFNSPKAFSW